jgi:hypothetical protein
MENRGQTDMGFEFKSQLHGHFQILFRGGGGTWGCEKILGGGGFLYFHGFFIFVTKLFEDF